MADFVFTGPGGQTITVTGPEGATRDQAMDILREQRPELFEQSKPAEQPGLGRSLWRGAIKGLEKFAVAPGEAEASVMNVAGTGDQLRGVPTQADVARQFPRPQGLPGQAAESIGEIAANPVSWLGPGGWLSKAASIVGSGLGSTIGERIGGPISGLVGGTLGGGLSGSAAERIPASRAAARTVPAEADIRQAGSAGYERARQMNQPLTPQEVGDLGRDIRQNLTEQYGHGPEVEPQTYRSVDRMIRQETARAPARRRMLGTDEPSTNSILNTRQRLTNIAKNNPATSEGIAARRAVDHIDRYMEQFPGLNQVLEQARGDWRASSLTRQIDEAVAHAGRLAGNRATNLRAGIRRILENQRIPKTPEQTAAMERVIGSGRLLEAMSHHWHHGFGLAAAAAIATGHWAALLPIAAAGVARVIPRRLDVRGRMRGINRLKGDILSAAPSGPGPRPTVPPWLAPNQFSPALLRSAVSPSLSDLANGQER